AGCGGDAWSHRNSLMRASLRRFAAAGPRRRAPGESRRCAFSGPLLAIFSDLGAKNATQYLSEKPAESGVIAAREVVLSARLESLRLECVVLGRDGMNKLLFAGRSMPLVIVAALGFTAAARADSIGINFTGGNNAGAPTALLA